MPAKSKSRARGADPTRPDDTTMEDVEAPPSAQRPVDSQENGDAMDEDQTNGIENDDFIEDDEEDQQQKIRLLPGSTDTAASFEFEDEGHTLGNALRYIIMKNPDVEFCAYVVPHPSEQKMNLRIQTYEGTTATAALVKGLQDLEDMCDVIADEFWTERNRFTEKTRKGAE